MSKVAWQRTGGKSGIRAGLAVTLSGAVFVSKINSRKRKVGFEQEETETTEIAFKEASVSFVHSCWIKNTMHPLFQKASGLTEAIIGAAIEVHRDKGPGLIESIYEWCLTKELELRGLSFVSQQTVVIEYKGFTREEPLRFDVLVDGCVLVEVKAVQEAYLSIKRNCSAT